MERELWELTFEEKREIIRILVEENSRYEHITEEYLESLTQQTLTLAQTLKQDNFNKRQLQLQQQQQQQEQQQQQSAVLSPPPPEPQPSSSLKQSEGNSLTNTNNSIISKSSTTVIHNQTANSISSTTTTITIKPAPPSFPFTLLNSIQQFINSLGDNNTNNNNNNNTTNTNTNNNNNINSKNNSNICVTNVISNTSSIGNNNSNSSSVTPTTTQTVIPTDTKNTDIDSNNNININNDTKPRISSDQQELLKALDETQDFKVVMETIKDKVIAEKRSSILKEKEKEKESAEAKTAASKGGKNITSPQLPLHLAFAGINVQDAKGNTIPFSSLWEKKRCVIFCLRRFGCLVCRLQAMDLSTIKPFFDMMGISLIGIGFETLGLEEFIEANYFAGDIYIDSSRSVYRAMKLGRMGFWESVIGFTDPRLSVYRKTAREMGLPSNFRGDGLQLSGCIVIGPQPQGTHFEYRQKMFLDIFNTKDIIDACKKPFPKESEIKEMEDQLNHLNTIQTQNNLPPPVTLPLTSNNIHFDLSSHSTTVVDSTINNNNNNNNNNNQNVNSVNNESNITSKNNNNNETIVKSESLPLNYSGPSQYNRGNLTITSDHTTTLKKSSSSTSLITIGKEGDSNEITISLSPMSTSSLSNSLDPNDTVKPKLIIPTTNNLFNPNEITVPPIAKLDYDKLQNELDNSEDEDASDYDQQQNGENGSSELHGDNYVPPYRLKKPTLKIESENPNAITYFPY